MAKFTGERVIPGQVDIDLLNEHVARYVFAGRLCRMKRVLDAGCGTGYGAVELARTAVSVIALDISYDAIGHARSDYAAPNLRFVQASCTAMPFRSSSFDLIVAFEVIEHLRNWPDLIQEVRRLLAPGGQWIVSTPNSSYYAVSRGITGPNPYHQHEFSFEEFRDELRKVFPHVSLFVQNHVEGFVFQPVTLPTATEARVEGDANSPEDSHFFLAVCALTPQTGAPTFVYVPRTTNILRERELHIERLNQELATKNAWIAQQEEDHKKLVDMFRRQTAELEERNCWAEELNARLEDAGARIQELQEELRSMAEGYEVKVAELEEDVRKRTEWARRIEAELQERTAWALNLQEELNALEARLNMFRASRWVKIGQRLGLGPEAQKS